MITKFKIYEQPSTNIFESMNQGEPEVGDYVICDENNSNSDAPKFIKDFISSNVGKIADEYIDTNFDFWVEYDNIPGDDKFKMFYCCSDRNVPETWRKMSKSEIKYFSKDKKELEAILAGEKFNV